MMVRFLVCFLVIAFQVHAQERQVILLDKGWKFTRQDIPKATSPELNDSNWETVTVPHDWAIKGPFDKTIDAQVVTVTEDGEKKPALRTGRSGSLPWIGLGWYRKKLSIPAAAKGKRVFIEFDGAMSHAVVYLNGEKIGTWPYGYASFTFELTDFVRFGADNILAVRLENPEESSRWYPGAGLYRNVRMVLVNPVHVKHWGTYVTTPEVNKGKARIKIRTEVLNQTNQVQQAQLRSILLDPAGKQVAVETTSVALHADAAIEQEMRIPKPLLWDIETPRLYKLVSQLVINNKIVDRYETPFGVRTIAFTNNNGFLLNGRQTKIKGVCNHHDLGPLGAAVNYRALERQLELLKEMGCNAIRTSHNPPAPELLELCDKMGFVVMDEAFDEWKKAKCKNGYNKLFDEWAEKDLRAMIKRDRNHPSVILWSVGNEVQEQKDSFGWKTARFLVDIAHDEDPTRLTTSAFNSLSNAIKNGLAAAVDVVGFNYGTHRYPEVHKNYPDWKLLGSETQSAVSSRGVYMFPVVERKSYKYKNLQSSSYDMESPSWGAAPDVEFALQDDNEFVAGEFVWTGFDYLGEPTPYNNNWPSHSSYFGILDLAGMPKDRYYSFQSQWTEKPVLHVFPHWNWDGREGEITPVHVYTSYDSAAVFLNGRSLGIRKKDPSQKYGRYRLTWDSVRYEPGEIKVVTYDKKGRPAMTTVSRTAGKPYQIKLVADRSSIHATGKDLSFVRIQVLDKDGNLCPLASNNIQFQLEGAGLIRGVANGDPANIQSLAGKEMQAFSGQCMVVVQSGEKPGTITLRASSTGLAGAAIHLNVIQ